MGTPISAATAVCKSATTPSYQATRIQQHRGGRVAATRLCLPRVEEGAGVPRSSSGTTEGRGGGASPPPARRRRRRRAAWQTFHALQCATGTGNGMARSLLHAAGEPFSISNAGFAIIRGHKRALDVTSVMQGKTRFFSVLMLTWGLVADVDIESEKYRWMGSARLEFYLLLRMLNLRRYNGRILFVPAPGYEEVGDPVEQTTNGVSTGIQEDGATDTNGETCGYVGPSIKEADLRWRSLNGPFVSVWLGNVPFASEDAMAAPKAEFADGYLDAAIIKDCPRWDVVGLMFQMKDGTYVNSPCVEYFKVKAIRIEPGLRVGSSTKGGIIDSDGEVIARGDDGSHSGAGDEPGHLMAYGPPIQLTVDQGLATIFSPR